MRASFDDHDFGRAVAEAADVAAARERLADGGLDWDYLGYVAVGVAREVLADGEGPDPGLGADAFVAGFLIAATLAPAAGGDLGLAVDVVQVRGRHALIADFCDLAATARFERAYAEALAESGGLVASEAVSEPLVRLFESGLATAFALALVS